MLERRSDMTEKMMDRMRGVEVIGCLRIEGEKYTVLVDMTCYLDRLCQEYRDLSIVLRQDRKKFCEILSEHGLCVQAVITHSTYEQSIKWLEDNGHNYGWIWDHGKDCRFFLGDDETAVLLKLVC